MKDEVLIRKTQFGYEMSLREKSLFQFVENYVKIDENLYLIEFKNTKFIFDFENQKRISRKFEDVVLAENSKKYYFATTDRKTFQLYSVLKKEPVLEDFFLDRKIKEFSRIYSIDEEFLILRQDFVFLDDRNIIIDLREKKVYENVKFFVSNLEKFENEKTDLLLFSKRDFSKTKNSETKSEATLSFLDRKFRRIYTNFSSIEEKNQRLDKDFRFLLVKEKDKDSFEIFDRERGRVLRDSSLRIKDLTLKDFVYNQESDYFFLLDYEKKTDSQSLDKTFLIKLKLYDFEQEKVLAEAEIARLKNFSLDLEKSLLSLKSFRKGLSNSISIINKASNESFVVFFDSSKKQIKDIKKFEGSLIEFFSRYWLSIKDSKKSLIELETDDTERFFANSIYFFYFDPSKKELKVFEVFELLKDFDKIFSSKEKLESFKERLKNFKTVIVSIKANKYFLFDLSEFTIKSEVFSSLNDLKRNFISILKTNQRHKKKLSL